MHTPSQPPAAARPSVEPERWVVPRADVIERRDSFEVVADVPGVSEKDVSIQLDRSTLTIEARPSVQLPGEGALYREFAAVPFRRAFTLSREIDRDRIVATVRDGVLRLTLPKAHEAQVRKVPVRSA